MFLSRSRNGNNFQELLKTNKARLSESENREIKTKMCLMLGKLVSVIIITLFFLLYLHQHNKDHYLTTRPDSGRYRKVVSIVDLLKDQNYTTRTFDPTLAKIFCEVLQSAK